MLDERNSNNCYYVCVRSYLCRSTPLRGHTGHVFPQDYFGSHKKDLYGSNVGPFPCSQPFQEARLYHEFLFKTEESYSLVMVIRICILKKKNMHFESFENFGKRSMITTLTAFIITHLLYFYPLLYYPLISFILLHYDFLILLKFL